MQSSYRWFNISPLDLKSVQKLAASLQKKEYCLDAMSGFNLDMIRTDRIEGKFTRKREFDEEVTDPLGGLFKVHRIAFDQCKFLVTLDSPNLRLQNSAKLGKSLTETIADALDYAISIVPIEIDPLRWVQCMADKDTLISPLALKSFPFEVSSGIAGSIRLAGSGDIALELRRLLGQRKVRTRNVLCTVKRKTSEWRIEFRSTGSVAILAGDCERIVDSIGAALVRATS